MVLPIFKANGGHLGFSGFYGLDFDSLFRLSPMSSKVEKGFEWFFHISTRLNKIEGVDTPKPQLI